MFEMVKLHEYEYQYFFEVDITYLEFRILDIPEDLLKLIDASEFLSCNNALCCAEAMD
jgi:hypothetical protein